MRVSDQRSRATGHLGFFQSGDGLAEGLGEVADELALRAAPPRVPLPRRAIDAIQTRPKAKPQQALSSLGPSAISPGHPDEIDENQVFLAGITVDAGEESDELA